MTVPQTSNSGAESNTAPAAKPELDASSLTRPQFCRVLANESAKLADCRRAWKAMDKAMALVPGGRILISSPSQAEAAEQPETHYQLAKVNGFYMDRMAVTHNEFYEFVRGGGYTNMNLWPNQIWPSLIQFVDQTGKPGPRYWKNGKPEREKLDHPVTGASWYEALAFANWVGKSLPTSEQWQRACTWGVSTEGRQDAIKFPWGNFFEDRRANLWSAGFKDTVPVDRFVDGCTANGIHQLIGNTWEWVDKSFQYPGANAMYLAEMAELRGGAFDTYFTNQATSSFKTGQPRLFRAPNIGFRCVIKTEEIQYTPAT